MAGPETSRVSQTWLALVNSGNIVYTSGLTDTPASGAPGAYKKMLANATPTAPWWLCAFIVGNASAAGATAFDYQISRDEAGGGGSIVTDLRILLEAATATVVQHLALRYPVRVATGVGAAARQTTASGKTLDCTIFYATAVGS